MTHYKPPSIPRVKKPRVSKPRIAKPRVNVPGQLIDAEIPKPKKPKVNTIDPAKRKNLFQKGFDPRRNLQGAPKRGSSLREILDFYDNVTAEDVAGALPDGWLKDMYLLMPKGIVLKHLKVLRINAAIINDPQPGLVKELNERTDGKVADRLVVSKVDVEGLEDAIKEIYQIDRNYDEVIVEKDK